MCCIIQEHPEVSASTNVNEGISVFAISRMKKEGFKPTLTLCLPIGHSQQFLEGDSMPRCLILSSCSHGSDWNA